MEKLTMTSEERSGSVCDVPADVLTHRQTRTLSICEEQIERDLAHDDQPIRSSIRRFRKKGEEVLHSPAVLVAVVVLNCLDCILVLTELILDVYFIKGMIMTAENTMKRFNTLLKQRYPDTFNDLPVHDTHAYYNRVLKSLLVHNETARKYAWRRLNTSDISLQHGHNEKPLTVRLFGEADDPEFLEDHVHSLEEVVAHVFHKISICILAILVLYIVCKVLLQGLSFFKQKLEVFDGVVVVASFIFDVYYMRGLTNYPIESFLVILSLMIPWRVLRVLNSLVIAVKDNYHLILKLMYKKTRYQHEKLATLEKSNIRYKNMITVLTRICEKSGFTVDHLNTVFEVAALPLEKSKDEARPLLPAGKCFREARSSEQAVPNRKAMSRSLSDINEVAEHGENTDDRLLQHENSVYKRSNEI